jgi:hypothetical protein
VDFSEEMKASNFTTKQTWKEQMPQPRLLRHLRNTVLEHNKGKVGLVQISSIFS